jgi:sulfatase maturation enzyme AslB (radical SAM superfamily)
MNKSFCVLPWINISVDPDGRVKPCCISTDEIKKEDGTLYNLGYDKLADIINSKDFQTIRRKMIDGELIEGCQQCYNNEKYGPSSNRTLHNEGWMRNEVVADKVKNHVEIIPETVQYFDLRFGNLCNLKCRSCSPRNSTQLNKEVFELQHKHKNLGDFFAPESLDGINDWYMTDTFMENLQGQAEHINRIYFTGGEPTLIDKNYEMLDYFIARDRAKDITLKFNTNMTNIKPKFLESVTKFKKVVFMVSIDGFGKTQEYLRYPSDWKQISNNLDKIVNLPSDRVEIICSPVVQKTNLSNIVELFDYLNDINIKHNRQVIQIHPTLLNNPSHLDLMYLPLEYKQKEWARVKEWIDKKYVFPSSGFRTNISQLENKCNTDVDYVENLKKFKEFTDIFDNHRGHYLRDINPELDSLMNK